MNYNIENEAYSYVGVQDNSIKYRCLVSAKEKVYLFQDK